MAVNTGKVWRIDVHHHVVPPQYAGDSMPIKLPDTETQLRTMDGWRIQTAITSLTPRVLMANADKMPLIESQERIRIDIFMRDNLP